MAVLITGCHYLYAYSPNFMDSNEIFLGTRYDEMSKKSYLCTLLRKINLFGT